MNPNKIILYQSQNAQIVFIFFFKIYFTKKEERDDILTLTVPLAQVRLLLLLFCNRNCQMHCIPFYITMVKDYILLLS